MPTCVRDRHALRDVHAEPHRAAQRERLAVRHLAAQRVRREVLHRDRVVAADVQEVVDADHVRVRDLAAVAQLVHEALHHLLVLGDARVQELEDQPLVDDRVLHQQHGAEGAAADALDVLVAALDDVAGLQRADVEPLQRLDLLHDRGHVGGLDQHACAAASARAAAAAGVSVPRRTVIVTSRRSACRARSARAAPRPRPTGRPASTNGAILRAHGVDRPVVGELARAPTCASMRMSVSERSSAPHHALGQRPWDRRSCRAHARRSASTSGWTSAFRAGAEPLSCWPSRRARPPRAR